MVLVGAVVVAVSVAVADVESACLWFVSLFDLFVWELLQSARVELRWFEVRRKSRITRCVFFVSALSLDFLARFRSCCKEYPR